MCASHPYKKIMYYILLDRPCVCLPMYSCKHTKYSFRSMGGAVLLFVMMEFSITLIQITITHRRCPFLNAWTNICLSAKTLLRWDSLSIISGGLVARLRPSPSSNHAHLFLSKWQFEMWRRQFWRAQVAARRMTARHLARRKTKMSRGSTYTQKVGAGGYGRRSERVKERAEQGYESDGQSILHVCFTQPPTESNTIP
jgi:hypothetical protein